MKSENFRLCWNLINLRPLGKIQNFADGNREDLLGYETFDDIHYEVNGMLENPSTNENPSDLIVNFKKYKLGDSCPMSFKGISYLDSIFLKRFFARTNKNQSLMEAANDKVQILRVVSHLVKTGEKVTPNAILSNLKFLVRTPGHFFPVAAKTIFETYSIPKTLCFDPFVGWGGRTLGSICAKVYGIVGCDLQLEVIDGCRKIATDFSNLSPTITDFHVQDSLEFLHNSADKFGLIFTSPPYMDTEDYGVESDAMRADWIDSFVFPLIEQFRRHLSPNGKVALHLKDLKGAPTFTAYHSAMKAFGFKHIAKHRYGRTWTQGVHIYGM
jgi:hypothetical protein